MFLAEDTEGAEVMNKVKKTCELCEREERGSFLPRKAREKLDIEIEPSDANTHLK